MLKSFTFFFAVILLLVATNSVLVAQTPFWQQTNGPGDSSHFLPVMSLATEAGGNIFAGTGYCDHQGCWDGGLYRSTDNGNNWLLTKTIFVDDVAVYALAINSAGHIFAGSFRWGVFRSIDNGDNWTQVNTGLTNRNVQSLAIKSNGHIFAGTYGGGVFRSTDNGDTWTPTGLTNLSVYSVAINSTGHIFAGAHYPNIGGGVFRSTDNGNNWTQVNTGLTNVYVEAIAINSNGHILAGTNYYLGGVFRSTNNGNNWAPINTGLTDLNVTTLVINFSSHILAGTWGGGIFHSTNNGDIWAPINSGLTHACVGSLAINTSGYIFAGTGCVGGGGVFRSVESTTSVREVSGQVPKAFALEQNYPNPFNPSTRIGFMIQSSGFTSLMVYNLLGQEVATLVNEEMKAGNYEVTWDAGGMASGVYLYRLQAGEFTETKKLVLMQ